MGPSLKEYMEFAGETIWQAGRLTLAHFQTALPVEFKGDDTPVTVADREAEAYVRRQIGARFPDHAVIGEEYGPSAAAPGAHRWYVDPIDGTKSFVHGVPLYGVLLGLEIADRIEVGAAYFPALDELLVAASGEGCWWNGRRAYVSSETRLERSTICHIDTASFGRQGRGAAWQRLQESGYYNAGWCDAYGYLLVATGRAEVALDPIMAVWDCAPFPVIMREAGGYFGDWSGNETIYAEEGLATTPALLPQVLALLAGSHQEG